MSDTLVIRADATPQVGTGHVMRCLALAQSWVKSGRRIVLIGRITVPWLQERLREEGILVHYLEGDVPEEENPQDILEQVEGHSANWVVLDGYHFSYACQKAVKDGGYQLLVVDDYNHLPSYYCDILLNQNVGAEGLSYNGQVKDYLLGIKYALIRREFSELASSVRPVTTKKNVQNVLVTLGGGDMTHRLALLDSLKESSFASDLVFRVVAGATPVETLHSFFADCTAHVEILDKVFDMPQQMLWCDVCITAGGSTCWELCALEIPFAAFSVAENQDRIVRYLQEEGVAKSWKSLCKKNWIDISMWKGKKLQIGTPDHLLSLMLNTGC